MSERRPRRYSAALWAMTLCASALAAPSAHAQISSSSGVGYVDGAIPINQLRMRFDSAYNYPFPNRGQFGYSRSPLQPGQPAEVRADAQEFSAYGELALLPQLSTFVEVPLRAIDPTFDPNASGFGDVNAGVKYAFLYEEDFITSFQMRIYAPTGRKAAHLGSGHASAEPALLGYARLSDCLVAEGELRLWVPLSGNDDFNSHVVRYGLGASYKVWEREGFAVVPVVEFVGWTFLDGRKAINAPDGTGIEVSASNDTIINAKLGVRFRTDVGDFYVGYGRALSGEPFYKDLLRVEYRYQW